jgi:hypothetical protein
MLPGDEPVRSIDWDPSKGIQYPLITSMVPPRFQSFRIPSGQVKYPGGCGTTPEVSNPPFWTIAAEATPILARSSTRMNPVLIVRFILFILCTLQ